ncbi:protein PAT1 homolog 1 [Cydia pomonella]|uniref:protein PAT1 homolog 1 n=1 Tax=Cydia pomonella TaxID=82600 RepID=UPI002ADE0966|nr:protein PAT1 homolog 1 [Cydia pomonella]
MADYFFGFDTSSSNLNDDEGAGEPSEDEYDALNDETFGQADGFDFEEHEHMASQLESSRRHNSTLDDANMQLEASLSQLVLDESEHTSALGSSVWRHDAPFAYQPPQTQTPAPILKNVCTVEEIERQLRQKQAPFPPSQNYFQPRFPPVILQRPPGLQAPVPLPFAPQSMPANNMMPMAHPNNTMNMPNQMGQNVNQFMQNANHYQNNMHPNMHMNQMPNQVNMGPNMNQMGQNQMMPNGNQFPGMNQPGMNQPGMNQPGMNQPGMNQPGMNQPGMNQFPHMMPRMMPPPGMGMPRQNFNPNVGQFNHNFRGPAIPSKPEPMMHIQKPQPNQSPPKNGKTPPKLQKSRVYNNSKTAPAQNMTSQNLVQLIQNTHPMLQFNNSYHNASHHPMLSRGFGQFPNNMAFGQRPNGTYNNNHRHMNGDEVTTSSDTDEYSGLMTQREKQWLINIQMLQLNTGTPYIHDFYYTVFLERQSQKEKEGVKEAHKANQQNHPFYSGGVKQESHGRERHNSNRHNSTSEDAPPRAYVPTQFENSLGKLQCGSVTAPRKIIDVELVGGAEPAATPSRADSVASSTAPAEVPREMRRTKQLLLDIEALYLILLRLEELNDPLAISNALILKEREEKQKQLEAAQKEALENELEEDSNVFLRNIESVQRRPKQDSPKSESVDKRQVVNLAVNQKPPPVKNLLDENKDELVDKMFAGLLHADRLAQMLTVRKGRTLVARFLARCGAHALLRAVWARALRALPQAARRDAQGLAALQPHYRRYIQSATGWNPILESCGLLAEALDPARTPYALATPLTLSCVCALIEKASLLVNTPEATSNERQWYKFLKTLARALKTTTLAVAKPVAPLPENKLLFHLKQLESRTTIEILQRGKSAEFADLSKADVMEQLIKHLC